jgi:E3 ubiquitin-protein ligase UBR4
MEFYITGAGENDNTTEGIPELHGSLQNKANRETNVGEFRKKFMMQLSNWFWQLLANRPVNSVVSPIGQQQFSHIEATVQALIEIFHAFTTTVDFLESTAEDVDGSISFAAQIYAQFLMAENKQVSFAAKQALIRVLRPKTRRRKQQVSLISASQPERSNLGSGDTCSAQAHPTIPRIPPPARGYNNYPQQPTSHRGHGLFSQQEQIQRQPHHAAALVLGPRGIGLGGIAGNLAALLPDLAGVGGANIPPPVLDMPAEVDDEAMVELAIALSLQEQNAEGGGGAGAEIAQLQQGLQGLQQGLQQLANLGGQAFDGYPGLQGLAGILGEAGVVGLPPDVAEEDEIMFNQV